MHGFGGSRWTVVHGSVCNVHAGQLTNKRLPFKDGLQHALAHLRLIRRVCGIKLAAGGKLRHGSGDVMVIRARAAEDRKLRIVLPGKRCEQAADGKLAHAAGKVELSPKPERFRHIRIERSKA